VALSITPTSGTAPLTVTASAAGSTDSDATGIASYRFDFGDGSTAGPQSGPSTGHTYAVAGTYPLLVSVTDTAGLTTTAGAVVTVGVAGNLVVNSTFEADLSGWGALAGCGLTRVAGGHNEGWAANLNNPLTTAQTCTLNDSPNWVARTVAGTYTSTVWVRASATGGQVKLRVREYNGATLVGTGTTTLTVTNTEWQQVTLTYQVLSPGSTLDLNVYETNQPAGSDLLVDDVSVRSN